MTSIVTQWERLNELTLVWEHNHISDGYDSNCTHPPAKFDEQRRNWRGARWRATPYILVDGRLLRDGE